MHAIELPNSISFPTLLKPYYKMLLRMEEMVPYCRCNEIGTGKREGGKKSRAITFAKLILGRTSRMVSPFAERESLEKVILSYHTGLLPFQVILLIRNKTLETLNISGCELGPEDGIALADVLSSGCVELEALSLDSSKDLCSGEKTAIKFVPAGESFEAAVGSNPYIIHLDGRMCNFSKESECSIIESAHRKIVRNLSEIYKFSSYFQLQETGGDNSSNISITSFSQYRREITTPSSGLLAGCVCKPHYARKGNTTVVRTEQICCQLRVQAVRQRRRILCRAWPHAKPLYEDNFLNRTTMSRRIGSR
ncbi:hypothetical protein ALC57_07526 [Trachymyrmex cornetzi]|uniref:Uncharacterized protein n=1 Tax=Trachymyrmex cornetzi TaxID=471704 RepID=A0A195E4X0_9HYME|nr:hypothetical protein ALC57_07526 [Trachymyrmex cornetzi]